MLPFDKMPYTNFHELNLAYFIVHFREIFAEWETLYNNMVAWREQTNADLTLWKTDTLNAIEDYERDLTDAWDTWKGETALDITDWKNETLDALDAWKTAFQTLFNSTFSNLSQIKTDAEAARDAAIAAQNRAEAAAESIAASVSQITTNTADIDDIKSALNDIDDIINGDLYNPYSWEAGTYQSITPGAILRKSDSESFMLTRKRFEDITSIPFISTIKAKNGYSINLLEVDNSNVIFAASGYSSSVTLTPAKKYAAVLKASNDSDISETDISSMIEVSVADTQIEKNRVNIASNTSEISNITDSLSEWTPLEILSGYGISVSDGTLISGSAMRYTDYVSSNPYTQFKVTCRAYLSICGAYSYDANKNPLRAYLIASSEGITYTDEIITPLPDEKFFRFSTVNVNTTPLFVLKHDLMQNPLFGKTILNLGDSIAAGDGNKQKAYADYIAWANNMALYNYALGGATLANSGTRNVPQQLSDAVAAHADDTVDYVLFEGGTNDLTNATPEIGELVEGFDIVNNPRDLSTILGAGEYIIGTIRNTWPNAKIIYVSVHKLPTRNLPGQTNIHNAMESVCEKWSIEMADIFNKGQINSFITAMLNGNFPAHPEDPAYPTGYDRTHPAENGYRRFYVPFIESILKNI